MKLNCKAGDLAIVANPEQAVNAGQLVEVLREQTGEPFKMTHVGYVWQVRTVSGRPTLHYVHKNGRIDDLVCGPAPDRVLRPIRGATPASGPVTSAAHPSDLLVTAPA